MTIFWLGGWGGWAVDRGTRVDLFNFLEKYYIYFRLELNIKRGRQKEYFVTSIFSVKNSHERVVECPVFRAAIGLGEKYFEPPTWHFGPASRDT